MSLHQASTKIFGALTLASLFVFAENIFGQQKELELDGIKKEIAAAQRSKLEALGINRVENDSTKLETKGTKDNLKPTDVQAELEALKAENASIRELLRKMEENQKAMDAGQKELLNIVAELKRQLQGNSVAAAPDVRSSDQQIVARKADPLTPASVKETPSVPEQLAAVFTKQVKDEDRYRDGIVVWETKGDAKVPFLLKFTNTTQFRYLNSLNTNTSFTDHLGVVHDVKQRHDLTVNREMFTLGGYIFDKRLSYGIIIWSSATTTQVIVTGNIGWRFGKGLTVHAGYWSVPGSRSLTGTFPYFTQQERTLADNFFRPGFTQGVWATGEPIKGLNYNVFLGNGLNTLGIAESKVDTNLLVSASAWYEPLGPYGEPGKSRNMYDDYVGYDKPRIRIGSSFTYSREDRFSNLTQSNPENVSMYNSDGVLTFSTGAFAKGVTVEEARYRMLAIDGGFKWKGFAVNGQYFSRWVDDFVADGPLPLTNMFDKGFELHVSKFIIPQKFMVYARGSAVFGQFGNSHEYAGGFKWYFLPTDSVWLTGELLRIQRASFGSAITPYSAGASGWVPMIQTIVTF